MNLEKIDMHICSLSLYRIWLDLFVLKPEPNIPYVACLTDWKLLSSDWLRHKSSLLEIKYVSKADTAFFIIDQSYKSSENGCLTPSLLGFRCLHFCLSPFFPKIILPFFIVE